MGKIWSIVVLVILLLAPCCGEAFPGYNYKNAKGEWVRKPHHYKGKRKPNIPPTATCKDGTLSFSHSKAGTCSHHGGVKR